MKETKNAFLNMPENFLGVAFSDILITLSDNRYYLGCGVFWGFWEWSYIIYTLVMASPPIPCLPPGCSFLLCLRVLVAADPSETLKQKLLYNVVCCWYRLDHGFD